MFDSSNTKKTRHKVMMTVELDDGAERLMALFVAPGTRVSDTLNDNRQFLPFEAADGSVEIIRKDAIRRIVPMESNARAARGPYDILGIAENASDAEVKAAYHKAIMPIHPDNIASKDLPPDFVALANRMSAQANEAYAKIKKMRGKTDE
ncbi:J domain-containing protein [Dongia rigui]|uniref:DnaJ domain-containing protein n=1 Tax=Dongia rigui TaxID=940149 RepID=A0ABU5DX15_9PROT|nr:DnaJ domain-containing protein [Dongia rigui]MDY0871248.1 DnaJ domain-containing protein [Dongia rigui]